MLGKGAVEGAASRGSGGWGKGKTNGANSGRRRKGAGAGGAHTEMMGEMIGKLEIAVRHRDGRREKMDDLPDVKGHAGVVGVPGGGGSIRARPLLDAGWVNFLISRTTCRSTVHVSRYY